MSKDKKTFELGDLDGAILFMKGSTEERQDSVHEFVIPEDESEWSISVRRTIAFFMYATQRADWVEEFEGQMGFLLNELSKLGEHVEKTKEKEERRKNLRLVE